jgi:hypothetical protein
MIRQASWFLFTTAVIAKEDAPVEDRNRINAILSATSESNPDVTHSQTKSITVSFFAV